MWIFPALLSAPPLCPPLLQSFFHQNDMQSKPPVLIAVQVLSYVRHSGVKHGLRGSEGCSEQLEALTTEVKEWKKRHQGAAMTGLVIEGLDDESDENDE